MKKVVFPLIFLQFFFCLSVGHAERPSKNDATPSSVVTLILQGDFKKASKAAGKLEKRLKKFDEASNKFVLGYVKYKMGRFDLAKPYLEQALPGLPKVADHIKYFLGVSCFELGINDLAIKYLDDIVQNYPSSVWHSASLWWLSHAYLAAKQIDNALKSLAMLDPSEANLVTPSDYNLFKADILLADGRSAEAVEILKQTYLEADSKPAMDEAEKSLYKIDALSAKEAINYLATYPARLTLAQQLIKNYRFSEGLSILNELASEKSDTHLLEIQANAYFKARDYEKSKDLYEKLSSKLKGDSSTHYLIRYAQSAARTNDFKTAIPIYKKLVKKGSKGRLAEKYQYKLGFLYLDSKQYALAIDQFTEMLENGYRGEQILWNIAWSYYKLGRYNEAIDYFKRLADGSFGKKWRWRSLYWMAIAHEKNGTKPQAQTIYREILINNEFDYYGFLAAGKLYNKKSIPNDWVMYSVEVLPKMNGSMILPESLSKAKYLFDIGLNGLALMEMRTFNPKNLTSKAEATSFMKFSRDVENYRGLNLTAIQQFKPLLNKFPYKKNDLREFVWLAWYPKAYPELVSANCKEFEVDPFLVTSIMREEARFQTDIVSSADAIGLMQIIPSTAAKLALELDHKDFSLADMYKPHINIRFAVKYLSDLAGMFAGEKAYIIASYNAGEEAVSRWVTGSDAKNIEEFIEEIPYKETNDYVKRVLKSYWIYQAMYYRNL